MNENRNKREHTLLTTDLIGKLTKKKSIIIREYEFSRITRSIAKIARFGKSN
jgi:hypothetical protein